MTRPIFAAFAACAALPATAQGDRLAEIAAFFAGADIRSGPEIVDCTLTGGDRTACFRITLAADPQSYTPGPWCPTQVTDGPEAGGIWFLDGGIVDVDGDFVTRLAEIYDDTNWQLFDPETGAVRFTGTLEACEAAARPDVAPEWQNHCVQCLPEQMPEEAVVTYVIPLVPVASDRPSGTDRIGAGVAANGVRLDAPAPVDAILGAYTIAPFDDCGGHVNPVVGYHYHAVTDCLEDEAGAAPIGLAMDGHPIFPHLDADGGAPEGLDACFGHEDADGYHYHAGAPGGNAILGCLAAQAGCVLSDPEGSCDASAPPGRGPRRE